ncbi:MAG: glycoside hydrolase family 1 protein [Candidatus Sericytochromatia bacterium]|nr:glycoside hydrolase family 1 protein [Candidatus Sericytochromatia bacterium]
MGVVSRTWSAVLGVGLVLLQSGCQVAAPSRPSAGFPRSLSAANADAPVPSTFLWGVSTAGHQSEGGDTTSNWAAWGQQGKLKDVAGQSVDFWNRYDEDFRLARGMGVNAFRMSIEWSRIEPVKGQWDEAAVAHYREMLAAMRRHGMTPVLTLSHWVMPAWVDAQGGWTNKDVAFRFARFVDKVTRDVAPDCKTWITFNEPNVWLPRDYLLGMLPPGKKGPINFGKALRNVIRGHALAYDRIHAVIPGAMVSSNVYQIMFGKGQPSTESTDADLADTNWFYDAMHTGKLPGKVEPEEESLQINIMGKLDYIAFDYYWTFSSIREVLNIAKPWALGYKPDHLETVLMDYHRQYHLPIMIAENGMATDDLKPRADGWTRESAMVATVRAMKRAMAQGAQVIGYSHWSLTDNYEWGSFSPRFGLFSVDCRNDPTLRRVPTPAVDAYRRIIAGGSGIVPPQPVGTGAATPVQATSATIPVRK